MESVDIEAIRKDLIENYEIDDGKFEIHPDGLVDAVGDITIEQRNVVDGRLTQRFGKLNGTMSTFQTDLSSVAELPRECLNLMIGRNPRITSWENGPEVVKGSMSIEGCGLTSMAGLPMIGRSTNLETEAHKRRYLNAASCPGITSFRDADLSMVDKIYLSWYPETALLSLLRIKDPAVIDVSKNKGSDVVMANRAFDIIRAHVAMYHQNSGKAMMACQEELIEAGLAGNARW